MKPVKPARKTPQSSQMNIRGVFLHVLGDALGSVVVIVSALIIWLTEWEYKMVREKNSVSFFCYTVKPVCNDLTRETQVVLVHRWLFFTGPLYTEQIHF